MCARCANRSNPPGHVQLLGSQKGWRLWFTSGSGVTLLLGNSAAISLPTQFYGHRCPAPGLAPREDRGAPRGRACAAVCGARGRQYRVSRSDTGQHGSTHHDTIDTGVNRQRLDRVPPRHTSDTSPRHSHTRHFRAQHSPLLPAVPLRGTVVEFPASPARRLCPASTQKTDPHRRTQSTEHISTHYGFRIGSG